jgi:hypothetical protein
MNLKLNSWHLQNIWNDNIDDDIGDTCPLIPTKIELNIEKYDLKNDFIIQSCNTVDHKTQNFEDDGFTVSSNFMIMNELEYWNMLKQFLKKTKINIWWYHVLKKNVSQYSNTCFL